jgi:hypothetical protein
MFSSLWLLLFGAGSSATTVGTRPLTVDFATRNFDVLFHEIPYMPRHVVVRRRERREPIRATLRHSVLVGAEYEQQPFALGDRTVTAELLNIETLDVYADIPCEVVAPATQDPEHADCGAILIALGGILPAVPNGQYAVTFPAGEGADLQLWPTMPGLTITITD